MRPDLSRISVEPPRDTSHGDLATNAAMVLAKPTGQNPRALAEKIAEALKSDPDVASAEVAGPGFVNLRIGDRYWHAELAAILDAGPDYGRSRSAAAARSMSNMSRPTRPARCMSAIAVARWSATRSPTCLSFAGYEVTKEYYINDAGVQIDVLARSVMLRYREALGDTIGEIPAGLYPGDYLVAVGQALAAEFGRNLLQKPEDEALDIVKDRTIDAMMAMIREDLALLNVHHEVFFSERALHAHDGKAIRAAITDLTLKGYHLQGQAAAAQGPEAGRLGRPRADAVPLDRGRRRYRPSAGQVRRLVHLFRRRRRLSQGQGVARLPGPDLRARRRS